MNAVARSRTGSASSVPMTSSKDAPGKRTVSSGLPLGAAAEAAARGVASGQLPPELAAHVGQTFVDGGHYVWRVESDGSFVCVAQPPGAKVKSVGARVRPESAKLWQSLCGVALAKLAPGSVPARDRAAGTPAAEHADDEQDTGGFSLDGFLAGLFAVGEKVMDIGSHAGELVTETVSRLAGSLPGLASSPPAPSASSSDAPSVDVAEDGEDAGAGPAATTGPAPAEPAPSDKPKSGPQWPSLATSQGWISSNKIGELAGDFGAAVKKFVAALEAAGATVKVSATYRHENRAYLMHFAWTVASGAETAAEANAACTAKGIEVEWDHGDPEATKAAAAAMKSAFGLVAKPALGTLHKSREAIDMKITGVPEQIVIDGVTHDTEPKTKGKYDEDKVDHIGRTLGVVWYGPGDYVHWSVNGK